jgi:sulfopyruvate decarboxylase TPP-binding subunit
MAQARLILEELKRNHVTHVIGLPDNSSAMLFSLLSSDREVRLISVTREGEAFAIAAGLWVGGKVPVVVVQNTGFLESGDGFRGTITRMRVPLVSLITYRGYAKMSRWRKAARGRALDPESLSRADLDSAALVTEATLKAWGLPFDFLHTDEDVAKISVAFRKAEKDEQAFALLITQDMT